MAFHSDGTDLVKKFGQEKFLLLACEGSGSMSSITAGEEIPKDNMMEVRLRRFRTENGASDHHNQVMKVRDARLSLPTPYFACSDIVDRFYIATPQRAMEVLKNLLKKKDVAERLSNNYDGKKVSYSESYRRLVSDLLDVSFKLWEKRLSPKLDMDSITILLDPIDKMNYFTLRVLEVSRKSNNSQELFDLIQGINTVADVELQKVVSSLELETVLDGIKRGAMRDDLFNMPFFWDHSRRVSFICALHEYLQRKKGVRFCDSTLTYAQIWETRFEEDSILRHLKQQDKLDRVEYDTKPLLIIDPNIMSRVVIEESNLRNWVDVMRQTYCHLVRMTSALLRKHKISERIDRCGLEVIYDKRFPNHIQLLKNRVDHLRTTGVCQVSYTNDGSIVIR